MHKIVTVNMIPQDFNFLVDSQDAAELRAQYPDYDAFFVQVGEGEYTAIYGIVGIVPCLSKLATLLHGEEVNHA